MTILKTYEIEGDSENFRKKIFDKFINSNLSNNSIGDGEFRKIIQTLKSFYRYKIYDMCFIVLKGDDGIKLEIQNPYESKMCFYIDEFDNIKFERHCTPLTRIFRKSSL